MDGIDPDWKICENCESAEYTNIRPGNYTFSLKVGNQNGYWNEDLNELKIVIFPPWYKSTAAKVFWVLLLGLLIWLIYRTLLHRERLKNQILLQKMETENLREVDQAKTQFFTQISHEFRTPLTVILGMAEQITKNQDVHFLRKASMTIQRNGKVLLKHINQILDLIKLQSQRIDLNVKRGNIVPYVYYLVEAYQSYAESKGIKMEVMAPEPIEMDYDAERIKDVLSNLISNAIKYNQDKGSIQICCDIEFIGQEPFLLLEVKDTGIGIAEQDLQQIFTPYHRIQNTTNQIGSGLGLAITKQWIEAMGGRIDVSSQPQKGSSFRVFLPILQAASEYHKEYSILEKPTEVSTSGALSNSSPEDNGKMVLLVDDHDDVLEYLKICINPYYQVITASNGKEGLQKARNEVPDLIVSDIMMDKMDGYQLVRKLKEDLITQHIPVILLTARTTQEEKILGLKLGADAYLSKPFDQAELIYRISNLMTHQDIMIRKFSSANLQDLDRISPHDEFLDQLEQFVKTNILAEFSVEDVAKHFNISRVQLYRKVKAITGKSVSAYIRLIRLYKGKQLLRNTVKSISEIAYEVGFKDPNYFSRSFQESFNQSPSEYRLRITH